MSCKEKFERNHVPSIVLVMSSTDMKPGVACAIYGRKELENECKYSLEVRTKKTTQKKKQNKKLPFPSCILLNAVISKPPENLPFAPDTVTKDSTMRT